MPVLKGTEKRRPRDGEEPFRVVAYDFGMKRNILRNLAAAGGRDDDPRDDLAAFERASAKGTLKVLLKME